MHNQNNPKKNRYPGIRSFETGEEHLFFGREEEAEALYDRVIVQDLSVLFSKSGIGKTSLINAGLIPLLIKDNKQGKCKYFPISIRLQNTKLTPLEHIKAALATYLDNNYLAQFGTQENSLWEWIKACKFKDDATPVLIFDQFEELFNHEQTARQDFTKQLANLINYYIPSNKEAAFQKIPRLERTPAQLAWYSQPDLRILLSIRADKLSQLDEMTTYIPAILHSRFHLKPLATTQAALAVTKPASLTGDQYLTLPFTYQKETIQHIITELADEKQEYIESFQLQLLCSTIEEKIRREQTQQEEAIIVTPNYLKDKPADTIKEGIRNILNNYYEDQLQVFPKKEQQKLRKFIEEGLIEKNPTDPTDGKRVNVAEGRAKNKYKITEDLLQKLLLTRLIRAENTHLGRGYELSHDTLVTPILQSFAIRKAHEEKIRWRRRMQLGAIIGVPTLAALIGAVVLFAFLYVEAEEAQKVALAAQIKAEKNLNKFKTLEIDRLMQDILVSVKVSGGDSIIEKRLVKIDTLLKGMPENQVDSITKVVKKYR